MNAEKIVRIGCGAGFWGDSAEGPAQLVRAGGLDYLVMDYLAEITMSLLARAKAKKPDAGYATDFVDGVMKPLLPEIARSRIKVVTNAGGVNAAACCAALAAAIRDAGLTLRVAAVVGDDLLPRADELRAAGVTAIDDGAPFPAQPWSANVYLGAKPIAAALAAGADIVVTGRCVDSALALGPLMHEFGWRDDDYDRLAAGSLVGHIIECGAQCTGGLYTDWQSVPGWDDMGFPIAECRADGSCVITKPAGTGGLVTPPTVAEQITYEIGDPARYLLPDVACDFTAVTLHADGPDRVRVDGARGVAPGPRYKASVTYKDGFRATAMMMIGGRDAAAKARRVADAILARTRRLFAAQGHDDYRDVSVEVLGAESTYGPHARHADTREVVLKIGVAHRDAAPLELFAREIFPSATAMAQGLTGFAGGRPNVQPVIRLYSCYVDKATVPVAVEIAGREIPIAPNTTATPARPPEGAALPLLAAPADGVEAPLHLFAHGRSGDKGDAANIGILARDPRWLPLLRAQLTAAAVRRYFAHLVHGEVTRYEWPGLHGFNFVLQQALGGGGVASLRHDPQGKAYAQMLLDFPLVVPRDWLAEAQARSVG
ncbi:MAG: acyclic terpene utilization AtuA family protein [Gammaproteobacteria bacterium]